MKSTVEMREQRHKLILESRAILDKADEEKRALTDEDRAKYDRYKADIQKQTKEIEDTERRNDLESAELLEKHTIEEERQRKAKEKQQTTTTDQAGPRASEAYRNAFRHWLVGDRRFLSPEEHRDLTAGTGTEGGYLYAPEQFVAELIQAVTDATPYRGLARVWPPLGQADTMSAPELTDRMAAAEWTSELGTPSTDSTLAFGKRSLTPHPLAKEILVSKVLLRKTSQAESIVRSELARVSAEAQENGFMTGTGVQQPLGIFTASDVGISTGRDVSTDNTTTEVTCDGLKNAKYTLKQAYWTNARWIAHREFAQQVALLKDGNGRYLWQDSIVQGEPDRLLGFPVILSEYASHVFTTGKYVAVLGDHAAGYWIVDSSDVQIQRAEELYIRSNQDLFVMRSGCDGAPVKEEAFVRVKLG